LEKSPAAGDSKHREKTMKNRAVAILVGLAISFALPILAEVAFLKSDF
jgi:hypothetical protein